MLVAAHEQGGSASAIQTGARAGQLESHDSEAQPASLQKFCQAVDHCEKTDVYCKASLITATPQGKQHKSGKWVEFSR
jgi:hypothetical protein